MDLDDRFKILLIDCEWPDIERFSQSVKTLPTPITIFLYGSKDEDDKWCINTIKHCNAILVNCRFSGTKEQLKGWSLAQKNAWGLGSNTIAELNHRCTSDIYSWLAIQYDNYMKEKEKV